MGLPPDDDDDDDDADPEGHFLRGSGDRGREYAASPQPSTAPRPVESFSASRALAKALGGGPVWPAPSPRTPWWSAGGPPKKGHFRRVGPIDARPICPATPFTPHAVICGPPLLEPVPRPRSQASGRTSPARFSSFWRGTEPSRRLKNDPFGVISQFSRIDALDASASCVAASSFSAPLDVLECQSLSPSCEPNVPPSGESSAPALADEVPGMPLSEEFGNAELLRQTSEGEDSSVVSVVLRSSMGEDELVQVLEKVMNRVADPIVDHTKVDLPGAHSRAKTEQVVPTSPSGAWLRSSFRKSATEPWDSEHEAHDEVSEVNHRTSGASTTATKGVKMSSEVPRSNPATPSSASASPRYPTRQSTRGRSPTTAFSGNRGGKDRSPMSSPRQSRVASVSQRNEERMPSEESVGRPGHAHSSVRPYIKAALAGATLRTGSPSSSVRRPTVTRRKSMFAQFQFGDKTGRSSCSAGGLREGECEDDGPPKLRPTFETTELDLQKLAKKHKLEIYEVRDHLVAFKKHDLNDCGTLTGQQFESAIRDQLDMGESDDLPRAAQSEIDRIVGPDGTGVAKFKDFLSWNLTMSFYPQNKNASKGDATLRKYAVEKGIDLPYVEKVHGEFKKWDVDKDNALSKEEFTTCFRHLMNSKEDFDVPPERVERFWAEVDTNRNGTVEWEEFFMWYMRYFKISESAPDELPASMVYRRLSQMRFCQG
mmetsp:Transcript_73035/g.237493  ORF Transcript_73035/g.237493 Transcript_73035/m.237493 type:complete len:711 (+) Transcript_73035:57-2189(+)